MTPRLSDRLARLEAGQRASQAICGPIPTGLCECLLRDAAERLGHYPGGEADTLADGLARALGHAGRIEADREAVTDPAAFAERVAGLWPRMVALHGGTQAGPETAWDNLTWRTWGGILSGRPHYRSEDRPTADAAHRPNGLPLFDPSAPSVRAALAHLGASPEALPEREP